MYLEKAVLNSTLERDHHNLFVKIYICIFYDQYILPLLRWGMMSLRVFIYKQTTYLSSLQLGK